MRWADMDLLGHVNNVVYVDYLQEARVDMLRTHGPAAVTGELAEGVVVVRHEVTYLAPLTFRFRPVSDRVLGHRGPGRLVHDGLRDLPRGPRGRGRAPGLPAGDDRADAVRLRHRAPAPAQRRRARDARELPRARTSRRAAVPRSGRPAATPVGHYPVHVRFSDVDVYGHVNNVKYFEYFQEARILLTARLWRELPDGTPPVRMVVAQTDVDYKVPILFRPEPYDGWSWISRVGDAVGGRSSP